MNLLRFLLAALLLTGCATTDMTGNIGDSLRAQIDADYMSQNEAAEAVIRGDCRAIRTVGIRSARMAGANDTLTLAAGFLRDNLSTLHGNAYTVHDAQWVNYRSGQVLIFRANILLCLRPIELA